ncbi:MAG: carboxypeptidase-like regulatory domain-containing protein [Cytophagales bacterium]|nr:carboxypeptidase-like regulatory domain-containing protein [Cytophagales bacterium]
MRNVVLILCLFGGVVCAQDLPQDRLSGYLMDRDNAPLIGAHIINLNRDVGTVSNVRGLFRMDVQVGDTLKVTHIGYEPHHVVIDASMVNRSLEITLSATVMELSSVMVFAEVNYRVPRRYRPQPIKIDGIGQEVTKKSLEAGDIRAVKSPAQSNEVPIFGLGMVIHGPFTFFTAAEKERRKAEKVFEETQETIAYQQFVNKPEVRDSLMLKYELSAKALDQYILDLNQRETGVDELTNEKQLWFSVSTFIENQISQSTAD